MLVAVMLAVRSAVYIFLDVGTFEVFAGLAVSKARLWWSTESRTYSSGTGVGDCEGDCREREQDGRDEM